MYHQNFVIINSFQHQLECNCPCSDHSRSIELYKGDVLTITSEKRYIDNLGWFFLIEVNNDYRFFMSITEIENIYNDSNMCSFMDLELRTNYMNFKVNESLDKGDRGLFEFYSKQLSELQELRSVYA